MNILLLNKMSFNRDKRKIRDFYRYYLFRYLRMQTLWLILLVLNQSMGNAQELASNNNINQNSNSRFDKESIKPLLTILEDLEKAYDINFSFELNVVEGKMVSNKNIIRNNLESSLDAILIPLNLQHKKIGDGYYVIQLASKKVEKVNNKFSSHLSVIYKPEASEQKYVKLPQIQAFQQSLKKMAFTVKGRITSSENGESLPGVNVLVKATNIGTVSDLDGNYTIEVPNESSILVYSFIGFVSEEIPVNSRSSINVSLAADVRALQEVVVIGYGERKKETYTGSVVAIEASEIVRAPVADLSNNLVGRLPGIIATQRTGEPGSDGSNISIRGISTTGSNDPLIVVDGIPRPDYGFSQIDPNEIQSISVLKDAAAAAVFGVRGANGVILVTTKRGKAGKTQFSFNTRMDFQVPTRLPQFLDSYNTALLYNEGLRNEGKPELYTAEALELYRNGTNPDLYPNTDWFDITLNDYAPQSQHNLNVSGGTDKARYFLSAGYLNQKGLYDNLQYKRYNFRSNIDVNVTNTTTVRLDVSGRLEDRNYPGISAQNIFDALMRNQPMAVGYYANGLPGVGRSGNPAESVKKAGYSRNDANVFQSLLSINQELPFIKGLSVKGQIAYDRLYRTIKDWSTPFPTYEFNVNSGEYVKSMGTVISLRERFEQNQNVTMEAHLNYDQSFGQHNFTGLLLYTQTEYSFNNMDGSRTNFISSSIPLLDVGGADDQPPVRGGADERARKGIVGRVTYDFASKYLFEANFRYDGSENFPKEIRWGFFPSVSAGWRISEEAFFKDNQNFVDNLKIRASIGRLGNDILVNNEGNVQRFAHLTGYEFGDPYVFNGTVVQTLREGRLPHLISTWEKATSGNLGFEASLWKSMLILEADLFYKRTKDILGQRILAIPAASGIRQLPFENLDIVENKGLEVVLGHKNQIGELQYYVNGNITFARNKILYIAEPEDINPNIRLTGRSINQYFGLQAIGLFESDEVINSSADQGPGVQQGDIRYADINNDMVIDDKDRVAIGRSSIPELIYGVSFGGSIKGFDLNVLWQGAGRASAYLSNESAWAFFNSGKATVEHLDRWTPDNLEATYPRMSTEPTGNNTRTSSYWIRDASYLRLKNVEVGYNFPNQLLSGIGISNLRIYLSGQNLLTFDKLNIVDPEGPGASGNAGRGWFYPQQKVYSMGLNLNF